MSYVGHNTFDISYSIALKDQVIKNAHIQKVGLNANVDWKNVNER